MLCVVMAAMAAGQITNPQPAPPADELQAVTVIFGVKDGQPTKWDGSATISQGRIERIKGYHFTVNDKVLEGNAWQCSTHPWPSMPGGMHPNEMPQPQPSLVIPIGVTIEFRAPAEAELTIKIPDDRQFSIRPMDIPDTGGIYPLSGEIQVFRTPPVENITDEEFEDDQPSIAVSSGTTWVAWMAYRDKADRVFLRSYRNGAWSERQTVTEAPGDLFGTAVAAAGGKVMVVWSEHEGANWRLQSRMFDGSNFGPVQEATGEGGNLFHRLAADPAGNFHLVYQSWRHGRSDIDLRSWRNGSWGAEQTLSDGERPERANDWFPAIAVDSGGTVWTAWDGYALGSYNIYLRSARGEQLGALVEVTNSNRFHAHPSLAVDGQDRVWIAWDEAPENWGKDVGFLLSGGTGLYQARKIKVAVYSAGQWMAPMRQPEEVAPWAFRRYVQTPRVTADSQGRVWLFARPRIQSRIPHSLWAAGGKWEVVATYYTGERWSELIPIPDSVGYNEGEVQAAAGSDGLVHLAMLTDNRLWGGPRFGEKPGNRDIVFTRLTARVPGRPLLATRAEEPPAGLPTETREAEQIARIRTYTIENEGKTYHIYRGDLHRHTDISMDGAGDGSLWDAYRYTMDGAGMDYFLLTDHQSGDDEYTWWRIDKSADMFHVPGFFTALYGTERSVSYPNGHRNLVFTRRGVPILPFAPGEGKAEVNTGSLLYDYLRKYDGIATSHTSHTGMGTDWRDNDPALEPFVEIFQGARTSAEHEGAPLAPTETRTELHAGGYRPLGFVWNAWKKGYKLGVQASSDHVSTHTSYACVIAEDGTREAIVDAMRKRHTYAATRNIILDYRISVDGKSYLQGDILHAESLPEIAARIIGTAPLKEVVVIRDNEYVYTTRPEEDNFLLSFRETSLTPGGHYYYVRAEQRDGNVAWASPIWVNYQGR